MILTLPGLEGFKMIVKANSVTFPDGSRQGLLVISPVTADKLPMAPPAGGAQFGVPAWTIQPSGTRFDPPIEVQMPNATGEIAGDNLPVVQWDHDLGQYVPMGRATVSGDGAYLITDAGSGITKAGWGGLCRYDECKTSLPKEGCGDCKKVEYKGNPPCPECVKDPSKDGDLIGAEISTQLDFEKVLDKQITDIVNKLAKARSPIKLEIKAKGKITVRQQDLCCSKEVSGRAQKKIGSGVGEVELEWKITPPWSSLAELAGDKLGLADLDLLSVKVKAFGGFGLTGTFDECKKPPDLIGTASGGMTGELVLAAIKIPKSAPFFDLEAIAGVTSAYVFKASAVSRNVLSGPIDWQAAVFVKGSIKSGTMKWSAINAAWPIQGSTIGTIDY